MVIRTKWESIPKMLPRNLSRAETPRSLDVSEPINDSGVLNSKSWSTWLRVVWHCHRQMRHLKRSSVLIWRRQKQPEKPEAKTVASPAKCCHFVISNAGERRGIKDTNASKRGGWIVNEKRAKNSLEARIQQVIDRSHFKSVQKISNSKETRAEMEYHKRELDGP